MKFFMYCKMQNNNPEIFIFHNIKGLKELIVNLDIINNINDIYLIDWLINAEIGEIYQYQTDTIVRLKDRE